MTRQFALHGWKTARNARKLGLSVLLMTLSMALLSASISCRKRTTASSDPAPPRPTAEAIAEADRLYAGREDLIKVREGLVTLRQAQATEPANYDLAWRLAKFNYYLGAHSPNDTEREKVFHDGIEAGKLAVKIQDGKPDGHFWLGANYGGSAQISTLAGLAEIEDIKREMETVLKLDEGYQAGSGYMVLGQVYLEAPRIFGGDAQKAVEYLEKGLRFGANNSLLRLNLAKAYAEVQRKEDARKQIETLLTMKAEPGYEPELKEAITEARKLAETLK